MLCLALQRTTAAIHALEISAERPDNVGCNAAVRSQARTTLLGKEGANGSNGFFGKGGEGAL